MKQGPERRRGIGRLLATVYGVLRDGTSALRFAHVRISQTGRPKHMTVRSLAAVFGFALAAAGAGSAEAQNAIASPASGGMDTVVAYTQARLHLRAAPGTTSPVVVLLPRGVRVSVGECRGQWCAVGYRTHLGYAAERYLAAAPPVVRILDRPSVVQAGGRGYRNVHGEWVPSPRRSVDGRPPAGASAQCRDGTYSFSRSRRGTCSWHGGVDRWL